MNTRLSWLDYVLVLIVGIFVAAFTWFAGSSTISLLPADMWNDFAVAAGVRPPASPFPLLWHQVVSCLVSACGMKTAMLVLRISGPVALGLIVPLVVFIFYRALPVPFVNYFYRFPLGRFLLRSLLLLGVCLFVFSEPVFLSATILSPDLFRFFLCLVMASLCLFAVGCPRWQILMLAGACAGFVAAESPIGIVLFIAFAVRFFRVRFASPQTSSVDPYSPYAPYTPYSPYAPYAPYAPSSSSTPPVSPFSHFYMPFHFANGFIFAFVGAATLNLAFFLSHAQYSGSRSVLSGLLCYLLDYVEVVAESSSLFEFFLIFCLILCPLAYVLFMRRKLFDINRLLKFRTIYTFSFIAVLAIVLSLPLSFAWFWKWPFVFGHVYTPYVLQFCLLGSSLTAMLSVCALFIELIFRDSRNITEADIPLPLIDELDQPEVSRRRMARPVVYLLVIVPFIVLFALLIGLKFNNPSLEAARILNDAARLVVRESGDVKYLWTDGSLDAAVECLSRMEGGHLKALSMMAPPSPYEASLRLRGETDLEVREALGVGAAEALRAWVRAKSPIVADCAIQQGFDLWINNQYPCPPCGGLVARTTGKGIGQEGIQKANDLADRIQEMCENHNLKRALDIRIYSMLTALQFRLARLGLMRSRQASAEHDRKRVAEEITRATRLDGANPELTKLKNEARKAESAASIRFTAKEGLAMGAAKGDLAFAHGYALEIVKFEPRHFLANYTLALGALKDRDFVRAEQYLRTCLELKPKDVGTLNGLAVVMIRLGRLDEAEKFAAEATVAMMRRERSDETGGASAEDSVFTPSAESVQKTLSEIRELKNARQRD